MPCVAYWASKSTAKTAFTYTALYAHSSKQLEKLAAKHKRAVDILATINSLAKPVVTEMSTLDLSGVEKKNKAKEEIAGYLKLFHVDTDSLALLGMSPQDKPFSLDKAVYTIGRTPSTLCT